VFSTGHTKISSYISIIQTLNIPVLRFLKLGYISSFTLYSHLDSITEKGLNARNVWGEKRKALEIKSCKTKDGGED